MKLMRNPGPEPEKPPICNMPGTPIAQVVEACSVSFQKQKDLCYMTGPAFKNAKIVLFTSTQSGCPFCLKMNPVFNAFAKKHFLDERGKVAFMQFTWNLWNSAFIAPINPGITNFNIQGLPTILALKDGKLVGRINGATSVEEIEKLLDRVKK